MKTVSVTYCEKGSTVARKVDFDLESESGAVLFGLFSSIQAGTHSIFGVGLSNEKENPVEKAGKIQLDLESLRIARNTPFDPSNWIGSPKETSTGTMEMTTENIQFMSMLTKVVMGSHVLTGINTTTFKK